MKNFLVILLLIISAQLNAQNSGTQRKLGSAKTLKGNIYTLVCFISEKGGTAWTAKEKDVQIKKVKNSLKWIEKQAALYNQKVNFSKMGTFGKAEDIKFDAIEKGSGSGKESVQWVSETLYKIGYNSTLTFYNQSITDQRCDEVQVLIFAKTNGTSYAIAMVENANEELYFVEGALIYENYSSGANTATSSIAHEILHLYGAIDLYKTFKQSEENAQKAAKLYPNSIMRRTSYNIEELNVDELNAWLIGWTNDYKPWFESFLY